MNEKGIAPIVIIAIIVIAAAAAGGGYFFVIRGSDAGGNSGDGGGQESTGLTSGSRLLEIGGDNPATFDFSTQEFYIMSGYDFCFEPWYNWFDQEGASPAIQSYDGMSDGVMDLGAVSLDSVTTVSTSGYSSDVLVQSGHTYAIKTEDGKYGLVYINFITYTGGEYPATVSFDWVYQGDGTASF